MPQRLPLIGCVEDREIRLQADRRGVLAQQPRAKAMKRAHPDARTRNKRLDAALHLVGRLVRECNRQQIARRNAAFN